MSGRRDRALGALTLGLCLAWVLLPLLPLLISAGARSWRFPDLLPSDWSTRAVVHVLSPLSGAPAALATSAAVALAATALALLVGVPAGLALGRHRFRGKAVVEILLLAPVVVPAIAWTMGLHGLLIGLGLANSLAGVVLGHLVPALPYVVLVTAGVFGTLDPAYEDQARSLGAGPIAAFRTVTLPMALPGVLVAALFAFLVSWSQYVPTLLIGGGRVVTLPLLLQSFASAGRHDVTGALAVMTILPALLVLAATGGRVTGRGVAARPAGPT